VRHDTDTPSSSAADIGGFCREVEAHLCRVNGGHLVRIVGPAFELVSTWAREGVPLRIVLHGVDRTVTRLTAKGPRRRPVRIEFCEADVRDAYDQWRRATGVRVATTGTADATGSTETTDGPSSRPRSSHRSEAKGLPRHLERVLTRLSAVSATREMTAPFREALGVTIREVDACLDGARGARGDARSAILARLVAIERVMTDAADAVLADAQRAELAAQVSRELSPYRGTMPPAAFRDAEDALMGELVRRHFSLPQVRLDG
jgi:hypothetical protein